MKIELRNIISCPQELRMPCENDLALAEYARTVGATDLAEFRINTLTLFAKLEWQNPSATIKDRIVVAMIADLLQTIKPTRLLEYGDEPIGVSLAKVSARLQLPLLLIVSDAISLAALEQLDSLGCDVITVDHRLGRKGLIQKAIDLSHSYPEFSFLNHYSNPAAFEAHRRTGEELIQQLGNRRIDVFGTTVGSGATFQGVSTRLKRQYPLLQCFTVSAPDMLARVNPSWREPHFSFSSAETQSMMRMFYEQTELKIGSTAAANVLAAIQYQATQSRPLAIVTVFASRPSRDDTVWLERFRRRDLEV